jgi:hypothetical protein
MLVLFNSPVKLLWENPSVVDPPAWNGNRVLTLDLDLDLHIQRHQTFSLKPAGIHSSVQ